MKDGGEYHEADAIAARIADTEKQVQELAARVAEIETLVKRNSKALTVVESTVGLDLMLAKIIIDH